MKNNLFVCVTHRWFHSTARTLCDGPKYNEVVTVLDFNMIEGDVYFILEEYAAPDKIGWKSTGFRKLINSVDEEFSEEVFTLRKIPFINEDR